MSTKQIQKIKCCCSAVLIGMLLAALSAGCSNPAGGNKPSGGTAGGGSGTPPAAPFVAGGASLILSPDKLDIKVKAITADGTPVTVEGCTKTKLQSGTETVLHAKGTLVTLKGNITELYPWYNQLTALNVQGLTALEKLWCYNNQLTEFNVQGCTALKKLRCFQNRLTVLNVQGCVSLEELECVGNRLTALNVQGCASLKELNCSNNRLTALNVQGCTALQRLRCDNNQLTAAAFKKLFDDLPVRAEGDEAKCALYIERTGVTEGNHTDFSAPPDLAAAFTDAKNNKKWKMYKCRGILNCVEI